MNPRIIRILAYCTFIAIALLSGAFAPHKIVGATGSFVEATIPGNDDIANATDLTSLLPLSISFSTAEATSQTGIDPTPIIGGDCDIPATAATVWYQYAPSSQTAISVDTTGSEYDTFIAVWLGPDSGIVSSSQLTFVTCNDDTDITTLTSQLAIRLDAVAANTTYYIEIGEYQKVGGASALGK